MSENNNDWLEPGLQTTGHSVARLSRSKAPAGLIERTLEKVALVKPLRRKLLLFRPITHPLARIAAVAMLMSMVVTVPLTDPDTVETVGRRVEYNVVGTKAVDRFEQLMDGLLVNINSEGYSQNELDALIGVSPNNTKVVKPQSMKHRIQPGV